MLKTSRNRSKLRGFSPPGGSSAVKSYRRCSIEGNRTYRLTAIPPTKPATPETRPRPRDTTPERSQSQRTSNEATAAPSVPELCAKRPHSCPEKTTSAQTSRELPERTPSGAGDCTSRQRISSESCVLAEQPLCLLVTGRPGPGGPDAHP